MSNQQWKITNPCTENWDKMIHSKNGRYCHVCQKEVLDLDNKVIRESITSSKFCGKITEHRYKADFSKQSFWFKISRYGLIALALILPGKKLKAQEFEVKSQEPEQTPKTVKRIIGNVKRLKGDLSSAQIQVRDSSGIIADTIPRPNGVFIVDIDTSKIVGDSVEIGFVNDTGLHLFQLDTIALQGYLKEVIFLNIYESGINVITLGDFAGLGVVINEPTISVNGNLPIEAYAEEKEKSLNGSEPPLVKNQDFNHSKKSERNPESPTHPLPAQPILHIQQQASITRKKINPSV